jgi:poly(hydroxyalkanoate) depolymerase family esterase
MARRKAAGWATLFSRQAQALQRAALREGGKAMRRAIDTSVRRTMKDVVEPALARRRPPRGAGEWIAGLAVGPAGARRFRLYRPPGVAGGERLPLVVMLHGCGQDAARFAASTRMHAVAARERFLVLYPEQDRLANAQGCWNWFETRSGRAQGEVGLVLAAIDQAALLYGADRARVAICGLSAGAGLAALAAARHPQRFRAVVMHSGVGPGVAQSGATALAAMRGQRLRSALRASAGPLPPLLAIQGSRDAVVAPANARAAVQAWLRAGDEVEAPAAREGPARRLQRGRRLAMTATDFRRGRRLAATLLEIDGLGHAWSGGAAREAFSAPEGPDASRLAWAFIRKRFDEAG